MKPTAKESARLKWLLPAVAYGSLWIVYAVLYALTLTIQSGGSRSSASLVFSLLGDVTIAGVLAAVFVQSARMIGRPAAGKLNARVVLIHFGLAVVYSAFFYAALMAFLTVRQGLGAGKWTPIIYGGAAALWQLFVGVLLYGTVTAVAFSLDAMATLQTEHERAARLDALRVKAELHALHARLNPHFLFNTLHTFVALARSNSLDLEPALEQLAAMLRYTLRSTEGGDDCGAEVYLAEEWEFTQGYLSIEQLRLGDALSVHTDIDADALEWRLPMFTLQPLVENAVRHGARSGKVRIWITAMIEGDQLCITVRDDGPGVPAHVSGADGLAAADGGQRDPLGLRLIQSRLRTQYGSGALFENESRPDEGFTARVRIPASPLTGNTPRLKHLT